MKRGPSLATSISTLLVLIPKVAHPENFAQFRPISLCNVLYKLITKVLANRMQSSLSYLINIGQSSFIPDRGITDNIIIAQEIIHMMRKKNGRKSMALKIDLLKAYDRLSWSFIEDTLKDVGFHDNFTRLVMFCVSSPSM